LALNQLIYYLTNLKRYVVGLCRIDKLMLNIKLTINDTNEKSP